jgi:transcriptional regulator with XRE-family HTH domain
MSAQTFGQWLKARREELGLTLREVERICEGAVSNATISMVETGKIERPSVVVVAQLAAAYGLMPDEVFERARNGGKLPPGPVICPTCGQFIHALTNPQEDRHD